MPFDKCVISGKFGPKLSELVVLVVAPLAASAHDSEGVKASGGGLTKPSSWSTSFHAESSSMTKPQATRKVKPVGKAKPAKNLRGIKKTVAPAAPPPSPPAAPLSSPLSQDAMQIDNAMMAVDDATHSFSNGPSNPKQPHKLSPMLQMIKHIKQRVPDALLSPGMDVLGKPCIQILVGKGIVDSATKEIHSVASAMHLRVSVKPQPCEEATCNSCLEFTVQAGLVNSQGWTEAGHDSGCPMARLVQLNWAQFAGKAMTAPAMSIVDTEVKQLFGRENCNFKISFENTVRRLTAVDLQSLIKLSGSNGIGALDRLLEGQSWDLTLNLRHAEETSELFQESIIMTLPAMQRAQLCRLSSTVPNDASQLIFQPAQDCPERDVYLAHTIRNWPWTDSEIEEYWKSKGVPVVYRPLGGAIYASVKFEPENPDGQLFTIPLTACFKYDVEVASQGRVRQSEIASTVVSHVASLLPSSLCSVDPNWTRKQQFNASDTAATAMPLSTGDSGQYSTPQCSLFGGGIEGLGFQSGAAMVSSDADANWHSSTPVVNALGGAPLPNLNLNAPSSSPSSLPMTDLEAVGVKRRLPFLPPEDISDVDDGFSPLRKIPAKCGSSTIMVSRVLRKPHFASAKPSTSRNIAPVSSITLSKPTVVPISNKAGGGGAATGKPKTDPKGKGKKSEQTGGQAVVAGPTGSGEGVDGKPKKTPKPAIEKQILNITSQSECDNLKITQLAEAPKVYALPRLIRMHKTNDPDLQKLTVPHLKVFLQYPEIKAKVGGKKDELLARLLEKLADVGPIAEPQTAPNASAAAVAPATGAGGVGTTAQAHVATTATVTATPAAASTNAVPKKPKARAPKPPKAPAGKGAGIKSKRFSRLTFRFAGDHDRPVWKLQWPLSNQQLACDDDSSDEE